MVTAAILDSDLGDGTHEQTVLARHGISLVPADSAASGGGDVPAEGLLVQWRRVDAGLLDQFPRVRAIVRYGIGLDNVDLDETARRGIRVSNVPDYCVDEVAAHTIALIVSRARRLVDYSAVVAGGRWSVDGVPAPKAPGDDPVGVAGLGRIGLKVARLASALGHPVHAWDPYRTEWPEDIHRADSLTELAHSVRHLSLHVPLSDQTERIVDDSVLSALGPAGHLVNTSRGGLIDEPALLDALARGAIDHASLDVLAHEPPSGDSASLAVHPRTTVTPHAAYNSDSARIRLQQRAAAILAGLLDER